MDNYFNFDTKALYFGIGGAKLLVFKEVIDDVVLATECNLPADPIRINVNLWKLLVDKYNEYSDWLFKVKSTEPISTMGYFVDDHSITRTGTKGYIPYDDNTFIQLRCVGYIDDTVYAVDNRGDIYGYTLNQWKQKVSYYQDEQYNN